MCSELFFFFFLTGKQDLAGKKFEKSKEASIHLRSPITGFSSQHLSLDDTFDYIPNPSTLLHTKKDVFFLFTV